MTTLLMSTAAKVDYYLTGKISSTTFNDFLIFKIQLPTETPYYYVEFFC